VNLSPAAVARSLDTQFRAMVELAAQIFSALVVLSGFVADGARWGVLGVAVGVPGVVLPYVARRQDRSAKVIWVLLVLILVLDLGVMSAITGTPGT